MDSTFNATLIPAEYAKLALYASEVFPYLRVII
jgi:hypothetical protein